MRKGGVSHMEGDGPRVGNERPSWMRRGPGWAPKVMRTGSNGGRG